LSTALIFISFMAYYFLVISFVIYIVPLLPLFHYSMTIPLALNTSIFWKYPFSLFRICLRPDRHHIHTYIPLYIIFSSIFYRSITTHTAIVISLYHYTLFDTYKPFNSFLVYSGLLIRLSPSSF
jgi:hypothetical protein